MTDSMNPRRDWSDRLGYALLVVLAARSAITHPRQLVRARREQVADERQRAVWAREEEARR